ncbi:MAG: 1-(5-phosphoribosyl)-5-[Clostridia bacterium]|nr:1-(5-phosphoribosyl)-5-[(5-phosphoribosylamino)methylideneamino]imidazole-4-carboxamide isomerase [Clostridia bacterium]
MNIFPAIDIIDSKAVRLYKGDYNQKTVYNDSPLSVAKGFKESGAEYLHLVDLDGAKSGDTPNADLIAEITRTTGLKVEIGGGIRSEEVIKRYIDAGVMRVILGTVAIENPAFTEEMVKKYGQAIAVGIDISEGFVATKGWTEISKVSCDEMFARMEKLGVKTVICTDISKDGAMSGTNLELYRDLKSKYNIDIVASGGVSSIEDVRALKSMDMYGAILGKALYEGAVNLKEAIEVAK